MQQFLKENIVLLSGIFLPVFLVIAFFIANAVTKSTVADPEYSAIFMTNYNPESHSAPYELAVKDGNLVISLKDPSGKPSAYRPKIFVFHADTLETETLSINFNAIKNGHVTDNTLDRLNRHNIITDETSPDGYRVRYRNHGGGNILTEMFGGGWRYRSDYALEKDGRYVSLRPNTGHYYSPRILGWFKESD